MSGVTWSSTVASTTVPVRLPPATSLAPLADRIGDQRVHLLGRLAADQRAQHDMAARIAGRQFRGARGELVDEFVGDLLVDDQPLGRHADLALVHEGAEHRGIDRAVDVGVVEHDQRRLAAELEQHRLEVAAGQLGDDPADLGRAGEVDAPDRRMRDQRLDDLRRVLRGRW